MYIPFFFLMIMICSAESYKFHANAECRVTEECAAACAPEVTGLGGAEQAVCYVQ